MKYYETTEKIYEFCKSYIDEHGYAPTIREIGSGVGLKSTSTVYTHMQRLFKMVGLKQNILEKQGHLGLYHKTANQQINQLIKMDY